MTVYLTLSNNVNKKTTAQYLVNVNNIKTKDLEKTIDEVSMVVALYDNVAPTVTGISYPDSNTIEVAFSEPINTTSTGVASAFTFKLDGVTKLVPVSAFTLNSTKTKVKIDIPTSGLVATKNYEVTISGLTDFAVNAIEKYVGTISFAKDETNPTVVAVSAIDTDDLKVEFSEKIKANSPKFKVYIDGVLASGTISDYNTIAPDGKTFVFRLNSAIAEGATKLVKITEYQDVAGNPSNMAQSYYITSVTFNATKPALTSATPVIRKINNDYYAVFTFDRDVTLSSTTSKGISGTYVDSNGVTQTLSAKTIAGGFIFSSTTLPNLEDNQIALKVTGFSTGNYTVKMDAGLVVDKYGNASNEIKNLTFSYATETVQKTVIGVWLNDKNSSEDTSLPATDSLTTDLNTVYVKFSGEVGNDALDVSKYTVDGVQVFEKAIFAGDRQTVKLTLKPGAIATTEAKQMEISGISNVKDITIYKNSSTAALVSGTAVYFSGSFNENVAPVLESAKLVDINKIQLKFSSDVISATTLSDYKVRVDGSVASIASVIEENGYVTITLSSNVSLDKVNKVTIEILDTNTIADTTGNELGAVAQTAVTPDLRDAVAEAKVALDDAFAVMTSGGALDTTKATVASFKTLVNTAKTKLDAAGLTNDDTNSYINNLTWKDAINSLLFAANVYELEDFVKVADMTNADNVTIYTNKKTLIDGYKAAATGSTDSKFVAIMNASGSGAAKVYADIEADYAVVTANSVATAETAAATAVTTTTKSNIDAAKTALQTAYTAVNAMTKMLYTKTALLARLDAAKASVANDADFTFDVTEGTGETIKLVYAGTDVTTFTLLGNYAVNYNPTGKVTVANNGAVTAAIDNTADSTVVTITDNFWGKSDTVTVNTDASDAVDVQND